MAEELKPCPFCGGTEAFVERLDYSAAYVQCDSLIDEHSACLARGPVGVQDDDGEDIPGAAAAIRAWNAQAASRATPPSPSTAEDEMRTQAVKMLERGEYNKGRKFLASIGEHPVVKDELLAELDWCIKEGCNGPRSHEALVRARAALSANAADRGAKEAPAELQHDHSEGGHVD